MQQDADVTIFVQIGDIVFPGSFEYFEANDELRVRVEAERPTRMRRRKQTTRFAWCSASCAHWKPLTAGVLREEWAAQSGYGHALDDHSNTWGFGGQALVYVTAGGDVETLATQHATAREEPAPPSRVVAQTVGRIETRPTCG